MIGARDGNFCLRPIESGLVEAGEGLYKLLCSHIRGKSGMTFISWWLIVEALLLIEDAAPPAIYMLLDCYSAVLA